jgi:predicted O-linked N-acetylglucosamine transferase (SPINDLY family)
MARKPAPVQITYLGYPGSTLLEAVDYRITDQYADPIDGKDFYSEKLLRLPNSLWCFYGKAMPEFSKELPAIANGYITFGSFNSIKKIDERSVDLWAKLLKEIPSSKLIMMTVPSGRPRERLCSSFEKRGVSPSRISFYGHMDTTEFRKHFQYIDIALDPVSVNGATTTCEALWYGVPTLSLVGDRFLERAGLSILTAGGIPEFAAANTEKFLEIANFYARNIQALADLRDSLGKNIVNSALMDGQRFAKDYGTLLLEAWEKWCNTKLATTSSPSTPH